MESRTITGSPFFSFVTFVVVWFAASDSVGLVARWCLPRGSFRGQFLDPAQWWKYLVLMNVWPGDGSEIFDGTENDSVDNELEDFFSFFALGRNARRAVRHLSDGLFDADSHSIDVCPSPTGRRLSGRPSKSNCSDECFHGSEKFASLDFSRLKTTTRATNDTTTSHSRRNTPSPHPPWTHSSSSSSSSLLLLVLDWGWRPTGRPASEWPSGLTTRQRDDDGRWLGRTEERKRDRLLNQFDAAREKRGREGCHGHLLQFLGEIFSSSFFASNGRVKASEWGGIGDVWQGSWLMKCNIRRGRDDSTFRSPRRGTIGRGEELPPMSRQKIFDLLGIPHQSKANGTDQVDLLKSCFLESLMPIFFLHRKLNEEFAVNDKVSKPWFISFSRSIGSAEFQWQMKIWSNARHDEQGEADETNDIVSSLSLFRDGKEHEDERDHRRETIASHARQHCPVEGMLRWRRFSPMLAWWVNGGERDTCSTKERKQMWKERQRRKRKRREEKGKGTSRACCPAEKSSVLTRGVHFGTTRTDLHQQIPEVLLSRCNNERQRPNRVQVIHQHQSTSTMHNTLVLRSGLWGKTRRPMRNSLYPTPPNGWILHSRSFPGSRIDTRSRRFPYSEMSTSSPFAWRCVTFVPTSTASLPMFFSRTARCFPGNTLLARSISGCEAWQGPYRSCAMCWPIIHRPGDSLRRT